MRDVPPGLGDVSRPARSVLLPHMRQGTVEVRDNDHPPLRQVLGKCSGAGPLPGETGSPLFPGCRALCRQLSSVAEGFDSSSAAGWGEAANAL